MEGRLIVETNPDGGNRVHGPKVEDDVIAALQLRVVSQRPGVAHGVQQ